MSKKEWINTICMIFLGLAFGFIIAQWGKAHNSLEIAEHNLKALQDTVRYHKDKNGNLYAEKLSLIAEVEDLKYLNRGLSDNVKSLEYKVKILSGVNTTVTITDTVHSDTTIYLTKDSTYNVQFKDSTIDAKLTAEYKNQSMKFFNFNYNITLPVEAYITADYSVLLRSKNPNIVFSDIQSFIDPSITKLSKNKRWGVGIQGGVGGLLDIHNKNFGYGVYIGLGIGYNIFQW